MQRAVNDERKSNTLLRYQRIPHVAVFAFACVLGSLAAWILAAEILRPTTIEFTTDAQSAASIYAHAMPRLWLPGLALCVETYGPKLHLLR